MNRGQTSTKPGRSCATRFALRPEGLVVAGCDPALGIAEALLLPLATRRLVGFSVSTGEALKALRAGNCHGALVHGPAEGDDDTVEVDAAERDGADPVLDDPVPLPHAAFEGPRLLLVEGPPDAFADGAVGAGELFGVVLLGP